MIVGTAGHIDHGKTSLVRALTGVDTDRLKEEKARGISVDLGFAYLPMRQGGILVCTSDGGERNVHQKPGIPPELFQCFNDCNFCELPFWRLTRKPCKKARYRCSITPVRCTGTLNLACVLHRL